MKTIWHTEICKRSDLIVLLAFVNLIPSFSFRYWYVNCNSNMTVRYITAQCRTVSCINLKTAVPNYLRNSNASFSDWHVGSCFVQSYFLFSNICSWKCKYCSYYRFLSGSKHVYDCFGGLYCRTVFLAQLKYFTLVHGFICKKVRISLLFKRFA